MLKYRKLFNRKSYVCLVFFSLINKIKPGIVKKINHLPTPIAGLVSNGIESNIWCINQVIFVLEDFSKF